MCTLHISQNPCEASVWRLFSALVRVYVAAHLPQYEAVHFDVTRCVRSLPTGDPWQCVATPASPLPHLDAIIELCICVIKAARDVEAAPEDNTLDAMIRVRPAPHLTMTMPLNIGRVLLLLPLLFFSLKSTGSHAVPDLCRSRAPVTPGTMARMTGMM